MEVTRPAGPASAPPPDPSPDSWPLQSGTVPALADNFSPRPETGFGPVGNLAPGETAVLTRPETVDGQSLAAAGGTGKTQLAVAFAETLWQSEVADLVLWVPAASRDAVVTSYARTLATITGETAADPDTGAGRFLGWLAGAARPWLIVLDDLADPADLAGLWPGGPAGRVLVTTRLQAAAMRAPGRKVFQVGPFSRREALTYLTAKLYHDPDQRIGALDLAADLGCLPLALGLAADTMTEAGIGCREYRAQFAERKQRIRLEASNGFAATTAAAWSLALDRADQLPPAGLARPALALIALLSASGIPASVLTSGPACAYITGGAAADGDAARLVLTALQNLAVTGLIIIDAASAAFTVRMHHLVQATIRQVLPPPVLEQTACAAADALIAAWPEDEENALLALALRACAESLHQAAAELLWTPEAHPVLLRAGHSLDRARHAAAAVNYWQMMADTSGRLLGGGHPQALLAADRLATAHQAAGRLDEAIAVHGRTLAEREQALGPGHPETLTMRGGLAQLCLAAGRAGEAIPLFERTVAGREWVLGPDHPQTLAARSDLAAAYRAGGRLTDAITVFERTLTDRELVLGHDHQDTLAARGNLAAALHAGGRLDEATSLLEETLADTERVLGPEHPDTITARAALAYAYRSADRLKEAIPLYRRVVADRELVLGPDHPDTMTARANLASAYQGARRLKDATALYEQTLADRERVQGPDHRDTLAVRGNLASVHQSAGRLASAIPLYEQTLAGCERVLGPQHRDTITSRANLAGAYRAARRNPEAAGLLRRALADCEQTLPAGDPLSQSVRDSLAAVSRS